MNLKYTNRTDFIVIGASALSLIAFAINTRLASIIPLYLNGIIVLGIFTYWAIRKDTTGRLKRSLIIGGVAGTFYTFVDSVFVSEQMIIYLRRDVKIFATPASIVLTWICCITIAIYLYLRLRSVFSRFYIPSALTGAIAFLSSVILHYLGEHARLWVWNARSVPLSPSILSTPLFVPVALFLTFFLSSYIVGGQRITKRIGLTSNPLVAGFRCAVILAMTVHISLYISFWILPG